MFTNTIYKCSKCGSTNIQIRAWVGANDNTVHEWCDDDGLNGQCWCEKCQKITSWVSEEETDGLIPSEKLTEDNIEEAFVRLVEKAGEKNELFTFDCCSFYGVELRESTIDKIKLTHDKHVIFYYNMNTGDLDVLSSFFFEELKSFYVQTVKALCLLDRLQTN